MLLIGSRANFNIDGYPLIFLSFEEREENQCENLSIRKQGEGLKNNKSVGLVNPTYKTLNFPFIQKENRRVRFNAPQPTPKEVFQC